MIKSGQKQQKWPKWVKRHMEPGIDFGNWPMHQISSGPLKTAKNAKNPKKGVILAKKQRGVPMPRQPKIGYFGF